MAAPRNPVGSKSDKHWREALRVAAFRKDKNTGDRYLDLIAQRLVIMAVQGDLDAIREIGDRLDGRVNQGNLLDMVAGETDGTVEFTLKIGTGTPKPLEAQVEVVSMEPAGRADD